MRRHQRDYDIAHRELVAEYICDHPEANESEAYDATEHAVYGRMEANYWCQVDEGRQRAKDI